MKGRNNADPKRRRKDEGPVIADPRFAGLHTDPRFQKLPKSRLRLPLDPRFQRMFTDKAFVDPLSLDKRGRPVKNKDEKKKKKNQALERYYRLEEEDDKEKEGEDEDDGVGIEGNDALEDKSSSSDDDGEDSESSSSDASSSEEHEEQEEEEEKVATTDKETKRLAVVNMDWSCIKAVDLLVLFNSFLPKGGSIASVAVYPSQFGLEQMRKEEVSGPTVFESKHDDDQEDEVDVEKLRSYEKSKLRYYFAVVTCDSVSTASSLYTACDGIEFERTSNILDLQFVPDEREFAVEPRDVASQIVDGYEAPDFQTAALQLSNVKLTWDDDEPVRSKSLRKKFDPDQIKEMDFKAYLASDDDEDEDDGRAERLRSLLLDGSKPDDSKIKNKDVDMEITFPSGLEELNKKYLDRSKNNKDETVWEAHLRKKKEKKLERKKREKGDADEEKPAAAATADEVGFDDPFFNSDPEREPDGDSESEDEKRNARATQRDVAEKDAKKKKKKQTREEREQKKREEDRQKAELELLLLEENGGGGGGGGVKGYNLKRGKKKMSKSKAKELEAKNEELLASTDLSDPRFSALFTSHHFAVDPTDPQFKRSAGKLRVIADMQQKRFQGRGPAAPDDAKVQQKKEQSELSSLVRSLKRKQIPTG